MQLFKAPTRDFLFYNLSDEPQHHHSLHAQRAERTTNFKSSTVEEYFCLIKAAQHTPDYFLLLLFQPPTYLTCQRSELSVPQNTMGATRACAAPWGWEPPTPGSPHGFGEGVQKTLLLLSSAVFLSIPHQCKSLPTRGTLSFNY